MTDSDSSSRKLSHSGLLELKRWNTPSVYNGWEQITKHDRTCDGFNLEPCTDFMPQMGVMVGYAVTLTFEPSQKRHTIGRPNAAAEYREYIASVPGPKIVVVQDLDKPRAVGSFWGEVNSNVHKALGCVGTITDGAIRDVDEMTNAGFKAIARCMCVGHAYSMPVEWGIDVEVFGQKVRPGQLIHADKHGFFAVPDEDATEALLESTRFMDSNECKTLISFVRGSAGKSLGEITAGINEASAAFGAAARERSGRAGEH